MITDSGTTVPDAFAPAQLGPVTLRNRIIKSATFEGRTPKGLVTDELIDFHRRFASGGVGMTTVAYCAVAPEGRTAPGQLQWTDEAMPGLRRLTDAMHAEGAAVSAQIGHAGPVAPPKALRMPALAASRRFHLTGLNFAQAASAADIVRITQAHVNAALRAAEAGFDAIEMHFGHGYLISSFLSERLNHRTDSYGGSLRNRARFARETASAVRDAVGDRIAILAKVNMDDGVPGGFWLAEAIRLVRWLEEDGSLDAVVLTAGSSLENPLYTFRGDAPLKEFEAVMPQPQKLGIKMVGKHFLRTYPYQDTYLLDHARQVRAAVDLPLVLLGGVTGRESIERAMTEGFEFVEMGRALLSDPDLVNAIQEEGVGQSLCIHCNKCMVTIYRGTHCVLRP
ncbi:NADH:flavin oxidoreductase [Nocardioides alcanivorans]|uniref:NADH:flavin oxidoreductase n=1 Tax=Nocardioides alcanivorans TaxID=2897352 RepID=UPI001F1866B2|nr:NADH:flavin oxidoreductase [Nocardioides alcanivorans]